MASGTENLARVHALVSAFIGSVKIPRNLRYSRFRYTNVEDEEQEQRSQGEEEVEEVERGDCWSAKSVERIQRGTIFLSCSLDGPDTKIVKSLHNSG